jgi:hypothetical protein
MGKWNHQTRKKRERLVRELIEASLMFWGVEFSYYKPGGVHAAMKRYDAAMDRCEEATSKLRAHIDKYGVDDA